MSCDHSLELSVVVPVFNEEAEVPRFLELIARQREIPFELILSDGGSRDNTIASARALAGRLPFPLRIVEGGKGRAAQMNLGASLAAADLLLFLHIDSRFPDPLSFRKGVDALCAALAGNGSHQSHPAPAGDHLPLSGPPLDKGGTGGIALAAPGAGAPPLAGHFLLEFDFQENRPPLPYRFYGAKASLDRPGCTHGDQGMLIPASFFRSIGPFDTRLPIMEDTFLAERIRNEGAWLLLPSCIRTSPRRFLTEGLLPRQTLNAMLMALANTGHLELIEALRECYRSQDATHRLELRPFLKVLGERIAALPRERRAGLWRAAGRYVRCNAWQVPLWLDVAVGKGEPGRGGPCLGLHDRWLGRLLDSGLVDRGAAWLVRIWFRALLVLSGG
ncbi:MAG TPA: glycosyltransferase [Geomonas sp.]|nr:glycosyltransferase [Geomonas sp.]